jgi:hypothetical protein
MWLEKAQVAWVTFDQWIQSSAALWTTAENANASAPLPLLSVRPGVDEKERKFAIRQMLLGDYIVLGGARVTLQNSN